MIARRNVGRFMGPVFEELALRRRRRDQIATMGTETRKDRQFLAANQNVDRIDLDDAHRVDRGAQMPTIDSAGGTRAIEPLRCEGDASRLGKRKRARAAIRRR